MPAVWLPDCQARILPIIKRFAFQSVQFAHERIVTGDIFQMRDTDNGILLAVFPDHVDAILAGQQGWAFVFRVRLFTHYFSHHRVRPLRESN
jgi:hypothetical protein